MSLRLISLLISFSTLVCQATPYWVATNGSNANPGSEAQPWLTIGFALSNSVAGDTITVGAGEYQERLTNTVSGSAGSPITFQGTRGGSGEWLTIIDPSTPLTNGWVSVGSGIYSNTSPIAVHELTIDNLRVGFAWTNGLMLSTINQVYTGSGLTNGLDLLAVATDQHFTSASGYDITFWDGIEALWTANETNVWLRLRDGSDPNGLNIRVTQNTKVAGTYAELYYNTPNWAAIKSTGAAYITYKNFLVRGAMAGFYLSGVNTHHWQIESNYCSAGLYRIYLVSGAANCAIVGNTLGTDWYGTTNSGTFTGSTTVELMRRQEYYVSKYIMGDSSIFDANVYIYTAGSSNTVVWNTINSGIGIGVSVTGNLSPPTTGTTIASNRITGQISSGVQLNYGETGTHVYDNLFETCNDTIRCHSLDTAGETNRIVYIYRNRVIQPEGIGLHIFLHYSAADPASYYPIFWFYHNSFSGGLYAIQSGLSHTSPGFFWVNNIFSSQNDFFTGVGSAVTTNASAIGGYDYNLLASCARGTTPAWFGASNIDQVAIEWTLSNTNLALTGSSSARDSAIDVTQAFTLKGTNYSALPNTAGKIGATWDMGALEYNPPVSVGGSINISGALRTGYIRGP